MGRDVKKSEFTIIERTMQTIEGFSVVFNKSQQQTILRGQSQSTLDNYLRQIIVSKPVILRNYLADYLFFFGYIIIAKSISQFT